MLVSLVVSEDTLPSSTSLNDIVNHGGASATFVLITAKSMIKITQLCDTEPNTSLNMGHVRRVTHSMHSGNVCILMSAS